VSRSEYDTKKKMMKKIFIWLKQTTITAIIQHQ